MEEYLEEIADSLAGLYIVNESEDGKSLELTPVNKEASPYYKAIFKEGNTFYLVSNDEVFENNEYSFKTDDLDELINLLVVNHDLDECYNQAGSIAKDGIEIDGIKGTISNSGLHEDYDEEAEVEENPHSYNLFLKFAKYHKDELQDTDDLWDMQDRILGMSNEEVLEECPEGFTEEDVMEMKDYLDHAFEADAFGKLWNQVHESCNKTEGFNSMAEDYIRRILNEFFEEEEFDIYDENRVVKDVIQAMKQDGVLMERPSKELKQLIKDLFEERLEKDILGEKKLEEDETGVDKAVRAIQQYMDNKGNLDVNWLTDNIMLDVKNTKFLYDKLRNTRIRNHSVAYEGLVYTLGNDNDLTFTSRQVQAAFKKLGLDYKEVLKPAIKEVDDYRTEMDNEEKLEGINEKFLGASEKVIDDSKAKGLYSEAKAITLVDLYNDLNRYDLDTEYREAFAKATDKLGVDKEDKLSKEQIQKVVKEIGKEMKGDYQYDDFKLFANTYLKEDVVTPEEVLELIIPNESDIQPEEVTQGLLQVGDIQNPEAEVTVATVDTNECPECLAEAQLGLSNLAKYLISAEASIKVLHHNLIGGEWFENHEKLGDYAYNIGTFQDDVIEQLIMLGGTEPSVEEAIKTYPTLEVQPRNKQESFAQLKVILDTIVSLIDQAKVGLADDIVSKLEEYQNSIRKEADYKVVRNLQEQYVLVSNKAIKNKLKLESKIEDVKKEAHDEAIRTGYDQYVYQLGEDIFFADNKPTDIRLVNRGILTLGRYRVGIENAKPVATWFEESKSTSKNKRVIGEEKDNELLVKDFNPEHNSTAQDEINNKADYKHNELNVAGTPQGKDVESVATSSAIVGEGKLSEGTKQKRIARYNEFDNGHVLHGGWKEMTDEEAEQKAKEASEKDPTDIYYVAYDDVMNPSSKLRWYKGKSYTNTDEVQAARLADKEANWKASGITESKEVPDDEKVAGEDYKVLTLDEYKKEFKKDIDNCYEKTYGKDMNEDLYNSLAEFMYSDSITGGINTKTTYKSMNDKIKEAEIFGKKVNIIDNAPDGHEDNQPK